MALKGLGITGAAALAVLAIAAPAMASALETLARQGWGVLANFRFRAHFRRSQVPSHSSHESSVIPTKLP